MALHWQGHRRGIRYKRNPRSPQNFRIRIESSQRSLSSISDQLRPKEPKDAKPTTERGHLGVPADRLAVPAVARQVHGRTEHVRGAVVQARKTDPRTFVEQRRSRRVLVPLQAGGAHHQAAARGADSGAPICGRPQQSRILVRVDQVQGPSREARRQAPAGALRRLVPHLLEASRRQPDGLRGQQDRGGVVLDQRQGAEAARTAAQRDVHHHAQLCRRTAALSVCHVWSRAAAAEAGATCRARRVDGHSRGRSVADASVGQGARQVVGHAGRRQSGSVCRVVVHAGRARHGTRLERGRQGGRQLLVVQQRVREERGLDPAAHLPARQRSRLRLWLDSVRRGGQVWRQGVAPGAREQPQGRHLGGRGQLARRQADSRQGGRAQRKVRLRIPGQGALGGCQGVRRLYHCAVPQGEARIQTRRIVCHCRLVRL